MTTTAKIAAKGTKNTGLTENHAKRLHDNLGSTVLALVELTSDARTEQRDGDEAVKLTIGTIEIVPEGTAADHVRELARLFHYERKLADEGPTLDGDDGPAPKVADILAAGQAQRPHPFLPDDAAKDTPLCDVCGSAETSVIHDQELRSSGVDDPFAVPDDEDDEPRLDDPDEE